MTRRKLVALVGVIVLFALGLVVFSAGLFVTHTNAGRERLRAFVVPFIKNAVKGGDIYIGHLGGSFLGGLTIDSVAIRDKRGDLFLSTGPISLSYNWRDIADQRIYISRATIEHPFVHIVQHETGNWNFKEIFASPTPTPAKPKTTQTRSLGDYIVIDSATAHNGTFLLSMPWHPDDTLHGARLDSVIHAHLTNPEKGVEKTFDGYARLYAWRNGNGLISHVRLADPDSDVKFGQEFKIGSLSVDEYVPTFTFKNVRGEVRHLGDSVWFEIPHFEMPASTGHGKGKVWWGSDLPVRYDIAVRGDSVSLDDVNWVYPTLPRTGGGTLDLAIKNDPKNLQVVDFRLQNMDVRSTKSHLVGDMWFGIGAPILLVRNVNLRADPLDFDLIRTLNGKPFPVDWQGQLIGTVKARGGPLTHFVVDDARGTFVDAHVRGAESRFSANGELDILYPAFTTFHGLNVDVASLDLRTIEYVLPSFPRLGGFVSGTAKLDSSWLDVRFSNAQVTHQDGPGEPSHVSGSGRVTYGEKFMTYDVNLNAEPLSMTMLARSYPALPAHLGLWSGPISASGSSPDLTLKLELQGANGAVSYDGRVDIDSVGGMGAVGHGQFSTLNLAGLLEMPRPAGTLSGHYDVDVAGETAATLHGSAGLELERTMLDSVRVYPSAARVRFAGGKMLIDSLRLHTDAATVVATGAIGLPKGTSDTLKFDVNVDSLGGLRHFISHPDTTLRGAAHTLPDSLAGFMHANGVAVGTLDAMRLRGTLTASDVFFKSEMAKSARADFDLANVPAAPTGAVTLGVDSVVVAGVALDTVGGVLTLDDATHARFALGALSHNGPNASARGAWMSAGGVQSVTLDSLGLGIADDRWTLADRPRFTFDSSGTSLDSLVLRNRDSAVVAMTGRVPSAGAAFAQLRASGLPLRDFGILAQLPDTASGVAGLTVTATGTRGNPAIEASAVLSALSYHDVAFERIAATAQHHDGTVTATLDAVRGGQTAITGSATLPISVSLFGMQLRNAPIEASLRADTTDLSILKLALPKNSLPIMSGRLAADVHATGTWTQPVFNGSVDMIDGVAAVPALGDIKFNSINGRLFGGVNAAGQDSINVRMSAQTRAHDKVSLTGFVRNLAQPRATAFSFALTADSLHVFNKRSVADLYVTTVNSADAATIAPIVLSGTLSAPVLSGTVNVDRGSIYLADRDLARKLTTDPFEDSTGTAEPKTSPFTSLSRNLQVQNAHVTLGQDVRLRSAEANVRLGGALEMINSPTGRLVSSSALPLPGLTLAGQLTTTGGTYNLNLGLVQREFQVLSDGTVTFDGGPPQTPLVDIRAQYNVKQYHDRDLGVIVTLKGRMPTPSIELSSNADYAISSSDLLSYLIVGAPGFDFGGGGQQQVLASVLSPTVSAFAADRLRQSLGGWLDAFQFQLGTSNSAEAQSGFLSRSNLQAYLYSSTVTAEKQLTSNLYLGVNTSFCQVQNNRLALGAKVEYRFKPEISLQAGYDPPTRGCVEGQQNVVGFVPTPSQWSLSLLHSWRF